MNERIVGKKAEPTVEELEFIYERLPKLSDQEVLEEMQDTEFPRRSLGFIKRRRREFNTAKRVLQLQLEKEVNPTIVKRREEHFIELADIVKSLLANGLESVSCPAWTANRSGEVKYLLPNANADSGYDELTKEQLTSHLNSNMATILKEKDWFFRYCFIPHLKSELPGELKTKLFYQIIEEQPYELIEILRLLAARKTFKGTCPVCENWHQTQV
jgi:hypothetical protein